MGDQKGFTGIDNPTLIEIDMCASRVYYLYLAHNMNAEFVCDQDACCLICTTQRTKTHTKKP